MNNRPLTDKEKQFTVLPNETPPERALGVANQAASRALADIKKTRKKK
ncbi:hypothetical protein [Aliikangiella maris]|uniref:Uncharacterized protein n=2 Tax=Aliikangiella maris TaxID=3162458 RepID=A0ABV3MSQ8_9GAMM